jgi:hypothetical protein
VPLENLFPTLPPTGDLPAFDPQTLSQTPTLVGENPAPNAFFLVVIDGPPGTVSNANKRDGSHLEFITRGLHHEQEPQLTHFVCMDDSIDSNCDDIHLDGLDGTILRMPDDMGFATYVVAHAVRESNFSLPGHLAIRAPSHAKVYELEYSYDFARVKRAAGDVFFRVDYSDSHKYYTDVVQATHQKKRELGPRFWSTLSSVWKTITGNVRSQTYDPTQQPTLKDDTFNVLIYGDDGSTHDCNGPGGFLKLSLAGSMRNIMRFGYTLVGTIQPFALEEAYGYFDSDLYMSGQLSFDGRGILSINNGAGAQRNLLASPITAFQASHPGIVSFSPQLNVEVSLLGSGQVDGQFTSSFELGSSQTLTTNAPPGLGTFGGDVLTNTLGDAATGYVSVDTPSLNTIFAVNLNVETTLGVKVFGYGTGEQVAGADFSARVPHAIRIVGNTGTGEPGILDAPQQATSDVIAPSGDIQKDWDDGLTHIIGAMPNPSIVLTGGDVPSTREIPTINDFPVFNSNQFIGCSSGSFTGKLVCTFNLTSNDSTLVMPDPPFKMKREYLGNLSESEERYFSQLDKRAGPSSGNADTYPVLEFPENPNGPTNSFNFETPTYPNGDNGDALDAETGE